MFRLLLRTAVQATLALAPFAWTIASFRDDKQHPWLPIILTLMAMSVAVLMDVFDLFVPHISAARFRDDYLKTQLEEWKTKIASDGIRINVMYVRRRWYFLFARFFQWDANQGFEPANGAHHDLKLLLHVRQGVCGVAFRANQIQFADLTGESKLTGWFPWPRGTYRLWPWQARKVTAVGVKAVLSVPMWRTVGPVNNPHYRAVGVINLDARTDEAAALLKNNRESLGVYFADEGKLLAFLPSQ